MACMEHICQTCGWHEMDNLSYKVCPICKGSDVSNWFDEETLPQEDYEYMEDE